MSMIGNYLRISSEQLAALREQPATITTVLFPDDESDEHPAGMHLDIDKAWHAIQFLLTGDPWEGEPPLQNAVMGGTELGEEDLGYGPARWLAPDEVESVAAALAAISGDELWSRFDAEAFEEAEIYPQGWQLDGRDYVVGHYEALCEFFAAAGRAGDAMLLYLS